MSNSSPDLPVVVEKEHFRGPLAQYGMNVPLTLLGPGDGAQSAPYDSLLTAHCYNIILMWAFSRKVLAHS